jgi:hypothetical protein
MGMLCSLLYCGKVRAGQLAFARGWREDSRVAIGRSIVVDRDVCVAIFLSFDVELGLLLQQAQV